MVDDDRQPDRPMLIRFPPGSDLRKLLEEKAHASRRTLTAEVISRLEFTLAVDVDVQDTGFDVGHGSGSAEWKAAMRERKHSPLEQRMQAFEERLDALEAQISKR